VTRPVDPSRALTPVAPVTPRTPITADALLGRSGVGVGDVLLTADVLEQREAVAPVALEMGLEEARASLLRQQPGDALAALDGVWAKARLSEEGWYLRSGALTVMGLPGEGDRVATEGLQVQPSSLALRLAQSVARVLVGDIAGARAVLAPALDVAPRDPVLVAQHAVILATQGYTADASTLVERLAAESPDHPAIGWARGTLRALAADRSRSAARRATPADPWRTPGRGGDAIAWPEAESGRDDDTVVDGADPSWAVPAWPSVEGGDVAVAAFSRLGTRLRGATDQELAREVRLLLRACSAGGTMCAALSPDQAHAARTVLAGLLTLLSPSESGLREHTPPAVATLLAAVVALRRDAAKVPRDEEVARFLRRASGAVPAAQLRLVEVLVRAPVRADGPASGSHRSVTEASDARAVVQGEPEPGRPLVPIRIGLALLTESRDTRAADVSFWAAGETRVRTPWREATPAMPGLPAMTAEGFRERALSDWTVARLVAEQQPATPAGGRGAGFVAVLCVTAALAAAINGATVIAVALGVGAAWLGVRRGARPRAD
jgi:hypothetical protein